MRVLDLFSGIGGFSLGLERAGMKTVAFCEIEPYCLKVLKKHWPEVPIYEDVRELTGTRLAADGIGVDVICGGFPCQDISSAGKKIGISGDRSGLWVEFSRIVCEVRPRYVIVENVSSMLARGMGDVIGDLAALGYDCEWHCISAVGLGACHGRDRVWIVGNSNSHGKSTFSGNDEAPRLPKNVADSQCGIGSLGLYMARAWRSGELDSRRWDGEPEDQPDFLGMDDGIPSRMDRLRSIGNAVVPQIPELIGKAIMAAA